MNHLPFALSLPCLLALVLTEPARAQNVTELYVSPDTLRLELGQRHGLTVQAFDDAGNAILTISFRATDSSIARIAANGTVSGVRAGRTEITVQAGQKTRSVVVLVKGPPPRPAAVAQARPPVASPPSSTAPPETPAASVVEIAQLVAEPASVALLPTENARVLIKAFRADGSQVPNPELIWRSLRPEVAALRDTLGTVTAVSTGQSVIQVVAGGATASISVVVSLAEFTLDTDRLFLAPGDLDTLTARVSSQGSRQLRSTDLQWSSSDLSVVQVAADGVVRAVGPGQAEVTARGYLQERFVKVVVHRQVAHFMVAPRLSETVRLPVQTTREFTLIPQTADSVPIEGVPLNWSVADTAIAGFDVASGTLTARRAGKTTLTFSARGFLPKGWAIEVLSGAVSLGRARLSTRPGERVTLAPQYLDQDAKPAGPALGLSWVTSDAAVARVSAEGVVEGIAPGRATITTQARGGPPATLTVLVTGDLLVASTRGGRFGIYALAAASPESFLPLVADSASNNVDPLYSPDRTRLVFASDRAGGNFDIYVADADGANPVRITTEPGVDHQPVWTPDGQRIVFTSGRRGARQLFVMNLIGGDVRQLTSLPGGAEEPAVSPDGRMVVFTGYGDTRDGPSDIFQVPVEGGAPTPITSTKDRREARPFYLPDGNLAWLLPRRDKREPDQVLKQSTGVAAAPMVSSELAVLDVALARDGSRIAWVASRPSERNKNTMEFTLQWRSLTNGSETSIRLLPGEKITSPAF